MSEIGKVSRKIVTAIALFAILAAGCSGSRIIRQDDLKKEQSVKLFLKSGHIEEGIVLDRSEESVVFVSKKDHQPRTIQFEDIRWVENPAQEYDYQGFPISSAEVKKYQKRRNTWAYAIGGGIIGGAAGLAVGLPVWLANETPPPMFAAGLGFVTGSIIYAGRGNKKDRMEALTQVRVLRQRENELEAQRSTEAAQVKALQEEKERLLRQLKEKQKQKEEKTPE